MRAAEAAAAAAAAAAALADGAAGEGRWATCSRTAPSLWLTCAVEGGKKCVAGEGTSVPARGGTWFFLALLLTSVRPRLLVALCAFFNTVAPCSSNLFK